MREPFLLTYDELRRLCPRGKREILQGIAFYSPVLDDYGLSVNELRVCHFLAQAAHETAGFRTLVEYGSSRYFRRRYGHRRDLGNKTREDGSRYRGRGIFQLTGRYNYRRYGQFLDIDLEAHPQRARDPEVSLRIACEYWRRHDLNRLADNNELRAITRRINGGFNGLRERRRFLKQARSIWSPQRSEKLSGPSLRVGDSGIGVRRLQKRLVERGYLVRVDGLFGRQTSVALQAFQKKHHLIPDGIFGQRSKQQLLLGR